VRFEDREEVEERSVLKLGWYSVSVREYSLLSLTPSLTGEIVLVRRLAEDLMEETKATEDRA